MSMINGTSITNSNTNGLPVNIVRGTHSQLVLFLVLNMWPSHFGLLVLIGIVVFSKKVKRHPTFVNLCVAFIIAGLSSSLLVYAGRTTGPEPSRMLCLFQASLLYGMPGLTSTAAFMLVLQMFFTVRASSRGLSNNDEDHFFRLWGMLAAPYLAWLISIIATAAVGAANPQHVSRNRRFFYCSVESLPLTNTLTVAAAIILFGSLVAVVWTMTILYKRMYGSGRENSGFTLDLNLPIRVMCFAVYIIVAMSLSLLSVTSPSSPAPDLVIASAATVVILIFGTQKDILGVIVFWRRPAPLENQIRVDLKVEFDREADIPPKVPEKDYPTTHV